MSQTTGPASAHPAPTDSTTPARPARRIATSVASKIMWMLVGAIVISPLATAAGIYVDNRGWLDFLGRPPTVGDQLQGIRQVEADAGRHVAVLERVRLHDSATSYLVIVADAEQSENPNARSDEVRIYDTVGDRLEKRFQFLPQPRAPGWPYLFQFDKVEDVDADGLEEILGSYRELYADGEFGMPVLIGWDPVVGRYRLAPL